MEIQIREGSREQKRKLKVCAYCRVSTDADEQENSLENQVRHYETVIKANPDYEYAGVYSDFAISEFVERFPELSLFYELSSPLDSEMICIFPYFCPYEESAREIRDFLFSRCLLLYQEVWRSSVLLFL